MTINTVSKNQLVKKSDGKNNLENEARRFFVLNAEQLSERELIQFFEPNKGQESATNPDRKRCSFDKIAEIGGEYFLVADRGAGKTHILKLLAAVLRKKKDVVVEINLSSNRCYSRYKDLCGKAQEKGYLSLHWKIAILEEVLIEILNIYPWAANSQPVPIFGYLKTHRRKYWEEKKPIDLLFDNIAKFLLGTKINVSQNPPFFSFSLSNPPVNSPQLPDVFDYHKLSEQLRHLESLCNVLLTSLNLSINNKNVQDIPHLVKYFSKRICAYVVADGLDQGNIPLLHADLLSLMTATKELNQRFTENFKMIVSFRSVTFDVLRDQFQEMEQIHTSIEYLEWDDVALERMVASRILLGNNLKDDLQKNTNSIIEMKFPAEFHYFGRTFKTMKFFFTVTGKRPRQIINLWSKCTEEDSNKDNPFSVKLEEKTIMGGFKKYADNVLPGDISKEYSSEIYWLQGVLGYLSINREKITQVITKKEFIEILKEYRGRPGENIHEDIWADNAIEIINGLFRVGIIGYMMDKTLDSVWDDLQDRIKQPRVDFRHHENIGFSPKMWVYLTNVKTKTIKHRLFYLEIYRSLKDHVSRVYNTLTTKNNVSVLEYNLGLFLGTSKILMDYSQYSEPVDWDVLQVCRVSIQNSWRLLSQLCVQPINEQPYRGIVDAMATPLKEMMVVFDGAEFLYQFYSYEEFIAKVRSKDGYLQVIEPFENMLNLYQRGSQLIYTHAFLTSLKDTSESLDVTLSDAIEKLESLTKG